MQHARRRYGYSLRDCFVFVLWRRFEDVQCLCDRLRRSAHWSRLGVTPASRAMFARLFAAVPPLSPRLSAPPVAHQSARPSPLHALAAAFLPALAAPSSIAQARWSTTARVNVKLHCEHCQIRERKQYALVVCTKHRSHWQRAALKKMRARKWPAQSWGVRGIKIPPKIDPKEEALRQMGIDPFNPVKPKVKPEELFGIPLYVPRSKARRIPLWHPPPPPKKRSAALDSVDGTLPSLKSD
ncbi:hypothetical protein DFJ74DRAFT_663931 [Hyaloraphidium curvatum]|nr:hypothetical protein DFJ74DRAFT_663931 [Hyaloraphidium curvatum]